MLLRQLHEDVRADISKAARETDANPTDGGRFDEAKVMLGFIDEARAKAAYLSNYSSGWKGFGGITAMTIDDFKDWVEYGDTGKKIAV